MNMAASPRGFSLVESMIGITVSSVLLAGVLNIYLRNSQNYAYQEAASRLQADVRYAADYIGYHIRAGGFQSQKPA